LKNNEIPVTKPALAPVDELVPYLNDVWARGVLTHNGPLVQDLEARLKDKFGLPYLALVTNGTIALQMAIKALRLKGEIITSPFTWIATASAIQWEGCVPVFCDIDPATLNIDPEKIEQLVTDKTVAIMPIHVFGNPCDVYEIERIARRHSLKVIYDAAHALGSTLDGRSILNFGDISTISLHATKIFNTGEGGACITTDPEFDRSIKRIRFFGYNEDKSDVVEDGLNGKMTEIHAAMGLANLKIFDSIAEDRRVKYQRYLDRLSGQAGLSFQQLRTGTSNYSYFPVIFDDECSLLDVLAKLKEVGVIARRYFYPSLNTYGKIVNYEKVPISDSVSKRILCLPLFYGIEFDTIDRVSEIILDSR
jgi:dTDP-4-amino-4,6-dideoxygalactose transaminase